MGKLNTKHKDRLFLRVFNRKEDLLSLYNAVNGSHHTDPDDLEITTLDNIVYMQMKNDVSFLLADVLNLWEHQSSYNPNMPVRGLSYFAKLYQKYIETHKINIYSSTLKKLPFPQYIVFYNGRQEEPDRLELKLSDAFRTAADITSTEPCLEVRAIMLNINYGKNQELMEQCLRLKEYSRLIAKIREYQNTGMNVEDAVDAAMDFCISEGILPDILSPHRAEVIALFLTDYDEQSHMEMERDEWLERGLEQGLEQGLAQGLAQGKYLSLINLTRKKMIKSHSPETIAELLEENVHLIKKICTAIQEHPDWNDKQIYKVLDISQ